MRERRERERERESEIRRHKKENIVLKERDIKKRNV